MLNESRYDIRCTCNGSRRNTQEVYKIKIEMSRMFVILRVNFLVSTHSQYLKVKTTTSRVCHGQRRTFGRQCNVHHVHNPPNRIAVFTSGKNKQPQWQWRTLSIIHRWHTDPSFERLVGFYSLLVPVQNFCIHHVILSYLLSLAIIRQSINIV